MAKDKTTITHHTEGVILAAWALYLNVEQDQTILTISERNLDQLVDKLGKVMLRGTRREQGIAQRRVQKLGLLRKVGVSIEVRQGALEHFAPKTLDKVLPEAIVIKSVLFYFMLVRLHRKNLFRNL